jgi:hypothetical protein
VDHQESELASRCTPPALGAPLEAPRQKASILYGYPIVGFGPEDPVGLLDSCYRAEKWILATHIAKALLIPRPWIDHPYGEEEIALLEEELLPAMAVFLSRVDAIDRAIEADQ